MKQNSFLFLGLHHHNGDALHQESTPGYARLHPHLLLLAQVQEVWLFQTSLQEAGGAKAQGQELRGQGQAESGVLQGGGQEGGQVLW